MWESDIKEHSALLQSLSKAAQDIGAQIDSRIWAPLQKIDLKGGIGILNAKNIIFIDYLINLHLYLLCKS